MWQLAPVYPIQFSSEGRNFERPNVKQPILWILKIDNLNSYEGWGVKFEMIKCRATDISEY